jgi:hypothetical protein
MAAAPGHPYLAKAIETMVNQIRNRFTSVDVYARFCPNPATSILETSVLSKYENLFLTGPCLVGTSINQVLRRDLQTQFEAGDVQMPSHEVYGGNETSVSIPGRTVILHQNKKDMGAVRFTLQELNLVAAVTDMPESKDKDVDPAKNRHYSKILERGKIYGLKNLYRDQEQADEDILIKVVR